MILRNESYRLGATIPAEMGKPITEALAEVEKCAVGCEFFADNAAAFLEDEPAPSDSPNSAVVFEPIGVILAIMPWNFPCWQVFRHCAPALAASNAVLLKHAPNVCRCALEIEEVFRRAGAPENLVRAVFVEPPVEFLIADPRVKAVTLTGSDRAGSEVAGIAGKHLKKTVLELGRSDAFIVLEDADVQNAVRFAVLSRFQNAGQSCIAAKRLIVAEPIRMRRAARSVGWILVFFAGVYLAGFEIAIAGGALLYLRLGARERWPVSLMVAALCLALVSGVFGRALHVPLPPGELLRTLGLV